MTKQKKEQIEKIAKEFASGLKDGIGEIAGSEWLIVDPLSGYLNFCGFENTLESMPETEKNGNDILIYTK